MVRFLGSKLAKKRRGEIKQRREALGVKPYNFNTPRKMIECPFGTLQESCSVFGHLAGPRVTNANNVQPIKLL